MCKEYKHAYLSTPTLNVLHLTADENLAQAELHLSNRCVDAQQQKAV